MKLFLLRLRQGNLGVTQTYLQINNPSDKPGPKGAVINQRVAEAIGQAYCAREPNRRYIRVEEAVAADESILPPDVLEALLNPQPPKTEPLTEREQRQLDREEDEDPMTGVKTPPPAPPPADEDDDDEEEAPPPPPVKKSKKR